MVSVPPFCLAYSERSEHGRQENTLKRSSFAVVDVGGAWSPASLRAWTTGSIAGVDARSLLDASLQGYVIPDVTELAR